MNNRDQRRRDPGGHRRGPGCLALLPVVLQVSAVLGFWALALGAMFLAAVAMAALVALLWAVERLTGRKTVGRLAEALAWRWGPRRINRLPPPS